MLDFGFSEIVLTSAIALIVLGPEKLPKVARQVGNWMGRARVMARQLTDQLEREVNAEELLRQTKANTTPARPVTSDPTPYDPSSFPEPLPAEVPAPSAATVMVKNPAGSYSADPQSAPSGADWHPSPAENTPKNE
ncbi:MAG TPA: Sec-independent protein translocase protein TatB [Steroidobacteraceae bacterium]|jgi:sec-independent protein translocase protein TatB